MGRAGRGGRMEGGTGASQSVESSATSLVGEVRCVGSRDDDNGACSLIAGVLLTWQRPGRSATTWVVVSNNARTCSFLRRRFFYTWRICSRRRSVHCLCIEVGDGKVVFWIETRPIHKRLSYRRETRATLCVIWNVGHAIAVRINQTDHVSAWEANSGENATPVNVGK